MFRDSQEIIKKFTSNDENKESDYLKRENANFIYGLPLLRHNLSNRAEEKFLMDNIFSPELKELYHNGSVYIHDKKLAAYCVSVSCKEIALLGVPTIAQNMLSSKPTKKFTTFCRHLSNVVTLMSQQVSGAVMLAQMTTVLASYANDEYERLGYFDKTHAYEAIKNLIWELNMPLRTGSQSPFSNITLEFGVASPEIADDYVIIGGEVKEYKYKDISSEFFNDITKIIINIMSEGSGDGIPLTFPLLTVPINDGFDWEYPEFLYLLDKLYDWGGVYFENFQSEPFKKSKYSEKNFMIKPRDPEVTRSMCCRLTISLKDLSSVGAGIFGSSTSNTGAVQVININLNRLFLESIKAEDLGIDYDLFDELGKIMDIVEDGQQAKRKWIENNKDLYPTFFAFNKDLKNYFNVFSICGLHEGLINIGYSEGVGDSRAQSLIHSIFRYIHEKLQFYIKRDKVACGLEYAPGENAAVKMARDDIKWAKYNNIPCFTQGEGDDVFLTSGAMLPFSSELPDQIENAAMFQSYATSGSILHHFINEKISPYNLAQYVKNLFKKPIIYTTITPTIISCNNCKTKINKTETYVCPKCGSEDISVYSRAIGYVKPISRGNIKINSKEIKGNFNFWSSARRRDWVERRQVNLTEV